MENSKKFSELINSLEEECKNQSEEIKKEIQLAIKNTKEELKSNLINLVFIGNYNAGKTTMINSLIASIKDNYDDNVNAGKTTMINSVIASIKDNYDDNVSLISSQSENSYFPLVVESSPDKYFYYMTIFRSNKTPEEIKCQNPEEINTRLGEMDNKGKASAYLRDLQNWEEETNEDKKKELEEKIPEIFVKIKIPNFPPELRLIDSPGLKYKILAERLFKLINKDYIMSIFLYLKSFTQEDVSTKPIHTFFKKIKDSYHNSIFCVCLTKYDQFLNEFLKGSDYYKPETNSKKKKEKNREAEKFIENFQDFKINELKDL